MGIFDKIYTDKEIDLMVQLLIDHSRSYVYFDNCYILDEDGKKTEILKFEFFPFVSHVEFTVSIDGVDKILTNRDVSLSITTAAHLNLQKIIKEFEK